MSPRAPRRTGDVPLVVVPDAPSSPAAPTIVWRDDCEKHDYPAAASYLALHFGPRGVARRLRTLRATKLVRFKAKDIFRASGLPLLGVSDSHVGKDRAKIAAGVPLSPLLLVRDRRTRRLIIADGYHRLCAVYGVDEDAWIPCRIA